MVTVHGDGKAGQYAKASQAQERFGATDSPDRRTREAASGRNATVSSGP